MLQIAIIGCGPAGLSAAIFLHDQGHAVTLYEQFDEARAVGSGLMLQPTGLEVLQRLGLRAEAEQLGQRVDGMLGRVAPNGKVVLDVQYDVLAGNHYGVAIHRAALFHVLYQAVLKRSITVLTNRHIDTLVTSESGVQFSDERSPAENVMYDFVIDASGRQSKLIKFAEKTPRRRELHYGALWGTVKYNSSAFNDRVLEQRYQQAKVMVGVLPCGRLPNSEERVATFFWSLRNDAYQRTVDAGIGA